MKKKLLATFILLVIIKIIIDFFISVPLGYSDSLAYMEAAKAFFNTGNFYELATTGKFPPLYPLIISIAYIFKDTETILLALKIINAILSSLILFPAYLLSKEFLNKKHSYLVSLVIAFLPPIFAMSFYTFSENLFFTLFMFTIYFIYKSFTENKQSWHILAGIGIGLCFLTRIFAIILFPLIITLIIIEIIKKRKVIYNKLTIILTTIIVIAPWIYIKGSVAGYTLSNILGYGAEIAVAQESSFLLQKIIWSILYTNYTIIALAIIPFILSIYLISKYRSLKDKEKLMIELTILTFLFSLVLAANNSGSTLVYTDHRVIGRYMSICFPLFILLSCINYKRNLNKTYIWLTAIFLAITTPFITFASFFPINNTSWTHIGITKYFLGDIAPTIIVISIILITLSFLLIKHYKRNTYIPLLLTFFILLSALNTAIIIYDAEERWQDTDAVQLGMWISTNIDPEATYFIDFDQDFNYTISHNIDTDPDRPITVSSYFIPGEISNMKDILDQRRRLPKQGYETDYIITEENMDLELIHEQGNFKLYKTH